MINSLSRAARLLALSAAVLSLPAQALYKVIGPDGSVTYTDRVPSASAGKASPLTPNASVAAQAPALPFELRQIVARYPVTLYVTADCAPCDTGRALLRQRGIPHAEKLVLSAEDAEALQRLTGARDTPALMIGQQVLRGLSSQTWNAYLDAAGYPRESRLPASYAWADATPLTERREPATPAAAAPAPRVQPPPAPEPAPSPSGIRF